METDDRPEETGTEDVANNTTLSSLTTATLRPAAQVEARAWPVWLVAAATLLNGLLSILQVLTMRFSIYPRFFNVVLPYGLHHWPRHLTLLFGFALIYLSLNLLSRKWTAWGISVGILLLSAFSHVGHGGIGYLASVPVATAALLVLLRQRFTVRSETTSVMRGVAFLALSLLVALVYGTAGFWLLEARDFGLAFDLIDALARTLREFLLIGNSDLIPHTRYARWFLDSLDILGVAAVVFSIYSLFRPLAYRFRTLPQERAVANAILARHGRSALDFFKLWPDKSYFFATDGGGFIAYRVAWDVAVCLGDPAGPAEQLEALARDFLRYCTDNGWEVAFHQALPDFLYLYRHLGLHSLKVGEEAVVDLERFCAHTADNKSFRQVQRRFEREGYAFARHQPPHPGELIDALQEVSNEWLTLPGRRERGFTLGQFRRDYIGDSPLSVVQGPDGRVLAFANEIPSYRTGEATIDLMRHRTEVPNGTMDFLFLNLLLALHQAGYRLFNLGMVPFVGVGDEPDARVEERALHELSEHLTRFFSYKGLRAYKSKFEPVWEDRFLIYRGGGPHLVRIAIAMTRVMENEG